MSNKLARVASVPVTPEDRFCASLVELGPVFGKIGQYLAMRSDLLDDNYRLALLRLGDRAEPIDARRVRSIIEANLDTPIDAAFSAFEDIPQMSGALTQAHRAVTRDGNAVLVKLIRPDVAAALEQAERHLGQALDLVQSAASLTPDAVRRLKAEIEVWLRGKTDFATELRDLERLHRDAKGQASYRIPAPYPQFSAGHVITMECLHGVPFLQLSGIAASAEVTPITGPDHRAMAAKNLIDAVLSQAFDSGHFQLDIHPDNLRLLEGNVVGFTDVSVIRHLDGRDRECALEFLTSVCAGEIPDAAKIARESSAGATRQDFSELKADFDKPARELIRDRDLTGPGRDSGPVFSAFYAQLAKSFRGRGIEVPQDTAAALRVIAAAETICLRLDPSIDIAASSSRILAAQRLRGAFRELSPEHMLDAAIDTVTLLRDAPSQVARLIADLADGRFVLRQVTSESAELRRAMKSRVRLLASVVAFCGFAVLLPALPKSDWLGSVALYDLGLIGLLGTAVLAAYLWIRLE